MDIKDFDFYHQLLKKSSGLVIKPDKSYLLDSRLTPVAKKHGYTDINEMTLALRGVPNKKLLDEIVEAMTTNETSFFRDQHPFDTFKNIMMPEVIENQKTMKRIRIWCAACSSGQEPYSLQMLMRDEPLKSKLNGYRVEIDATDISHDIINQAKAGIYSQFEVQRGLPITYLMNHFEQVGEKWKIKEDIKKEIKYFFFNLLDSMSTLGKYDIIFCRNVLIYFDEATKKDVLERMTACLNPNGFLLLGGAETVLGITDKYKLKPGVRGLYVLNKDGNAASGINRVAGSGISS